MIDEGENTNLPISTLGLADAGELLTLQRAAFVTEAVAHDSAQLAPFKETLPELREALASPRTVALGIRDGGRLIASVRVAMSDDGSAYLSRLVTAPDRVGEGHAARLLDAADDVFPDAPRIVLYTADWSPYLIEFYERHGYRETARERHPDEPFTAVIMEKPLR